MHNLDINKYNIMNRVMKKMVLQVYSNRVIIKLKNHNRGASRNK